MWIGQHSERLRVNTVGWVAPTHNPVRTAEYVATLDHILKGRLGVGFVRGYQARWVHTFRIRPDIDAVGPWNAKTPEDDLNRDYFKEFVDIILLAWAKETFSFQGRFWTIPDGDFVNPHPHARFVISAWSASSSSSSTSARARGSPSSRASVSRHAGPPLNVSAEYTEFGQSSIHWRSARPSRELV